MTEIGDLVYFDTFDASGDPVAFGGVDEPGGLDYPDGAYRRLRDWGWMSGLFLESA